MKQNDVAILAPERVSKWYLLRGRMPRKVAVETRAVVHPRRKMSPRWAGLRVMIGVCGREYG